MKILLDMDGVLAQFIPALIEEYNFLTNEHISEDEIKSFNVKDYVNDPFLVGRIKNATGFARNLKPYDGALDAVNFLVGAGHEILFVSCPTNCPTSAHEKREWLNYYFSKLWQKAPLITTPPGMKKHVRGDVLVDDDPKNLDDLHPATKGLLWHTRQNAAVTGYERVYSWDHLIDWIEKNEQPNEE